MRLLLISPASGHWHRVGRGQFRHGKTFRFSMLSLLTVAADTPSAWTVRIVDEQIDDIPWDDPVDLVGITAMTATAPRAYEIATRFRRRGVPVVLGGIHATLRPEEALQHVDAVVAGDVEGLWEQVLNDVRCGALGGVYQNPAPADLARLKPLPRHLLRRDRYATIHAVQATRGCPHRCDFCAVSVFHQHRQRRRPVEEVVREVADIPDRFVMFVDDNMMAHDGYARELLEALIPLRKWWMTQSSLAMARDEAFIQLAARAGCKGVFVGLETISQQNLGEVRKNFNRVEEYRRAIRRLHAHGIGVEAGVVFGFDGDRPEVFETTLRYLDAIEIDVAQISVLTPLPGTPLAASKAGRIFDRDWSRYDFHHAVFEPQGMTAAQLQSGHDWITREFYRPWRIARRLARHAHRPGGVHTLSYLAAINLAYYGRVRQWGIGASPPTAAPAPAPGAQPNWALHGATGEA